MTTATAPLSNRTLSAERTSRPSLEEPVERLMAALFREEPETAAQSAVRRVHEARRLSQAGDLEGARRSSPVRTRRRRRPGRRVGPTPSGFTWCGGGSTTGAPWP